MSNYISIKSDNPALTYFPGSILTGKIIAFLAKPKNVKNITIFASGKLTTSFHYQSVLPCKSEKIFFEYYFSIWKFSNHENLSAGKHTFEFSFKIPQNCLPNFESEYGNIRYFIKAKMDMPLNFNLKCEQKFMISYILPLTIMEKVVQQKFIHKFGNLSEVIYVEIIIPKKHYIFGETIKFVANIQNHSNTFIETIETGITTKIKYKAKAADSWRGKYFEASETEIFNSLSKKNKLYINGNQIYPFKRNFELEKVYPSIFDELIDVKHSVFVRLFVKKDSVFAVTFSVPINIYTSDIVDLSNTKTNPPVQISSNDIASTPPHLKIIYDAPPSYSEIDNSKLHMTLNQSVFPPKYQKHGV